MSMKKDAPKEQKAFYDSVAWKKCRREYIASVGGVCERCLTKGIVRPGKIVHHKKHISIDNIQDPEVLLCFDNLEYLCQECHNEEHDTPKLMMENRPPQREVQFKTDNEGRIVACVRPKKLFIPP